MNKQNQDKDKNEYILYPECKKKIFIKDEEEKGNIEIISGNIRILYHECGAEILL